MPVFSKELFEEGGEADYYAAALALTIEDKAGRLPPIPQASKDEGFRLLDGLADQKMRSKYGESLAEAFGMAYRFATSETWEDLDSTHARKLIDESLSCVLKQHIETGEKEPLVVSDSGDRIHYTTLGLVGSHPASQELCDYINSRSAYHRLGTLTDTRFQIARVLGGVKHRHTEEFMKAWEIAWVIGEVLGVLDVLGEIPK